MRILIQRTKEASVTVEKNKIAEIGQGLLVFVGIEEADDENDIDYLAKKLVNLRIFDDENGVMNRSVIEVNGDILIVSQFTLQAKTRKGNRPSYINAAKPEISIPLYDTFCKKVTSLLKKEVGRGQFGADMKVALINDGPVTIWIDSKNKE